MISSTLLTLIVIPAIFGLVKGFGLPNEPRAAISTDLERRVAVGKAGRSQAAE
jgi:Cu(I)/Ag(I) efflux system membrane protein CusA/SilA